MKTTFMLLLSLFLSLACGAEPVIVNLTSPQTGKDPLKTYNGLVLALALEKTQAEYGDFLLKATPVMNTARALEELRNAIYPNQVLMTSFQNKFLEQNLDYARFPVEYGVTGYRICFVSPQAKAAVAKVQNLNDLRQFSIGQGVGWADAEILRYNGFKVVDISQQESAYRMVAAGRIDLFCRGINELEPELINHTDLPGLDYDHTIALSYPLPRFFITNKQNSKLLERITKGLAQAYQDGSLRKIWLEQYESALRFANLKQRKILYLKTPNIDRIDFDYQKYYFDPRK